MFRVLTNAIECQDDVVEVTTDTLMHRGTLCGRLDSLDDNVERSNGKPPFRRISDPGDARHASVMYAKSAVEEEYYAGPNSMKLGLTRSLHGKRVS